MAQLEFVDTYLHIMDPFNPDFPVPWFQPEATHAHLGEHLERLKGKRHLIDDCIEQTRSSNVVAAVYVDAWTGTKDPVKETQWVQAETERAVFPQAIVTFTDELVGAYNEIISDFSLDEQKDMFSRNALALYHIEPTVSFGSVSSPTPG